MGETAVVVYPNQSATDPMWRRLNQTRDFRIALSHAINRDDINELLYNGLAEPAWKTYIDQTEWDQPNAALAARYSELVALYQYDPNKANQLLDTIGLNRRDRDGFRLGPDGRTLEITIEPLFGYVNLYEPFELIREYWNNVGLKTALKPTSIELWWPRIYSSEFNFSGYQNTRVQWLVYPRDWAPLYQHTYWAPNFGYWYDSGGKFGEEPPEELRALQRMFTRIRETPDDAERDDLSRRLLMTHGMNMYSIPVAGVHPTPYVAKNNFRNVPETGYMVWPLMSPGHIHPEQFFIRSA
jgi:peptide/nickel transport system substrate-binding protein